MDQDNSIGRTAVDNVANHFFARSRGHVDIVKMLPVGSYIIIERCAALGPIFEDFRFMSLHRM